MHISGGSGHFHLSRDPPPPYTANTTYTTKHPRQIAVSYLVLLIRVGLVYITCFCSSKSMLDALFALTLLVSR